MGYLHSDEDACPHAACIHYPAAPYISDLWLLPLYSGKPEVPLQQPQCPVVTAGIASPCHSQCCLNYHNPSSSSICPQSRSKEMAGCPGTQLGAVCLSPTSSFSVLWHKSPCSPLPKPRTPVAVKADGERPSTAAHRQELSLFPAISLHFFSFPLTISHSLFYIKPALVWLDP